jgi:hypothetical protein
MRNSAEMTKNLGGKRKKGKEMSLGSTSLSERKLALPLVIAAEKLIDFVSTPSMDDTDWGTA